MKSRFVSALLYTLVLCLPLYPAETGEPDMGLSQVLTGLAANHPGFRGNEAALKAAVSRYAASMAAFKPKIDISFPVDGYTIPTGSSGPLADAEFYRVSASGRISLQQFLPTAGTLSGVLGGTLAYASFDDDTYSTFDESEAAGAADASVRLSQPLAFKGAFRAALSRVEASYRSECLAWLREKNWLTIQAVRDYSDCRIAAYQASLIEARLAGDRETFRRVEREHELGTVSRAVWYQARSALLQAEADLLKARQALEGRRRILEISYGVVYPEEGSSGQIEDLALEPGDREDLVRQAVAGNLDMEDLRASIALAEAEVILARKDHGPNLETSFSLRYDDDLTSYELPGYTFSIGLSLGATVSDGGAYRHGQAERQSRLEALRAKLAETEGILTARVHALFDTLEREARLGEIYALQEEAALFDLERGTKDYEMGRITRKELLERQQELETVRMNIQASRIERNMAFLELRSLTGVDLHEWISAR